jgi:tetratricopeptide (TPR) repeat protein
MPGAADSSPTLEKLEAALRDRPDDPELHLEYAGELAQVGRWVDALATLEVVARLNSERAAQADVLRFEARALFEVDRYSEVLERLDRLAALEQTDDPNLLFLRGMTLNALDRYAEASVALEDAATRWPAGASRDGLFLHRLNALTALGRSDAAIALAAEAEQAWTGPAPIGGALFLKVIALNQIQRHGEAVETAHRALSSWPPHKSKDGVLTHAGLALNELGRHAEALESLDEAQRQPTAGGLHDLMALQRMIALNGLGRHGEAIAQAEAAESGWRGQQALGFLFLHKAIALNETGRAADALVAADAAVAHWPPELPRDPPLLQQALALNGSQQFERALAVLDAVDGLASRSLPAEAPNFARGIAQYQLNRLDAAVATFARVPDTPPVVPALASALSGLALVRLDRPEEAEAPLGRAVELASHLPPPLAASAAFLLGTLGLRTGRPERAVEPLQLAVRLTPAMGPAWTALATTLLQLGRVDEAARASEQAVATAADPRARAQAWLGRAVIEMRRSQPHAAVEALAEAARHDPPTVTAFDVVVLEAAARFQLGQSDAALETLGRAPTEDVTARAWLQVMRAGIELQRGNLPAALAAYTEVTALPPPPAPSANLLLAQAVAQLSLGDVRRGAQLLDAARALSADVERNGVYWLVRALSASTTGAAAEALEAADRGLPLLGENNQPLRLARGMALAALGRHDDALAEFDAALAGLEPSGAVAGWAAPLAIQKGFVHARRRDFNAALLAFRTARAAAADALNRMSAVAGEGLVLAFSGQRDEAVRVLRAGARASEDEALPPTMPHRGLLWWALGTVLAADARDEEALDAFTRAARLQPADARIQFDRGCLHAKFEEFEAALAAFRIAAREARDDGQRIRALIGQGGTLVRLERHDEAVAIYRAALEFDPDHADVWQALGEAYAAERRHGAAHQAFRRAHRRGQAPTGRRRSSLAALGVSAALLGLQKNEEAWQFLDRVRHEVEPDPRLDFNRGISLTRLRRYREAIEAFRAARGVPGAADQVDSLEARRARARPWLDFWFGPDASWAYRVAGGVLLLLVVALMGATLIDTKDIALLARVKTEHAWKVLGALIVILLLPSVGRLKWGDVEIQSLPSEITPEAQLSPSVPTSALAALLDTSSVLGSAAAAFFARPLGGPTDAMVARAASVEVQRTTLPVAGTVTTVSSQSFVVTAPAGSGG